MSDTRTDTQLSHLVFGGMGQMDGYKCASARVDAHARERHTDMCFDIKLCFRKD